MLQLDAQELPNIAEQTLDLNAGELWFRWARELKEVPDDAIAIICGPMRMLEVDELPGMHVLGSDQ